MKFAAARSHHKENLDSILDLIYSHLLVDLKSQLQFKSHMCSFMCVSVGVCKSYFPTILEFNSFSVLKLDSSLFGFLYDVISVLFMHPVDQG